MSTFDEWFTTTHAAYYQDPDMTLRLGQYLYNHMPQKQHLLDRITGDIDLDPYYSDSRIPEFLAYLILHWEEE